MGLGPEKEMERCWNKEKSIFFVYNPEFPVSH